MRRVLAQRVWSYVGRSCARGKAPNRTVPDALVNDYEALNKLVDDFLARNNNWKGVRGAQRKIHNLHMAAITRVGGYLTLQCSIVYRAYRLAQDSVDIAEGLEITPGMVRQCLARCNDAARRLGYECNPPHWTKNSKRPHGFRVRAKEKGPGSQRGKSPNPDLPCLSLVYPASGQDQF